MSERAHLWFWRDSEGDEVWWPEWLVWLWQTALRLRCLGLFHRFEDADSDPLYESRLWYCVRCLGPYERDEEFVLSSPWSRFLWRITPRLYYWWHSWSWRFTER